MKKWYPWVVGVIALVVVAAIGFSIWSSKELPGLPLVKIGEPKIEPNAWQPYKAIDPDDSTHALRVVWAQKYGEVKTVYCKVVFRNDKEKQYKLVAPWLSGFDIERQNMDDIKFEKILIDSVPAGIMK